MVIQEVSARQKFNYAIRVLEDGFLQGRTFNEKYILCIMTEDPSKTLPKLEFNLTDALDLLSARRFETTAKEFMEAEQHHGSLFFRALASRIYTNILANLFSDKTIYNLSPEQEAFLPKTFLDILHSDTLANGRISDAARTLRKESDLLGSSLLGEMRALRNYDIILKNISQGNGMFDEVDIRRNMRYAGIVSLKRCRTLCKRINPKSVRDFEKTIEEYYAERRTVDSFDSIREQCITQMQTTGFDMETITTLTDDSIPYEQSANHLGIKLPYWRKLSRGEQRPSNQQLIPVWRVPESKQQKDRIYFQNRAR